MKVGGSVTAGLSQTFDADAVFMRDFTKFYQMPSVRLLKMALIFHDIYGSLGVVSRILTTLDIRERTKWADKYIKAI